MGPGNHPLQVLADACYGEEKRLSSLGALRRQCHRRPHTCVVTAPGGHKDVVVEHDECFVDAKFER